MGKPIKITGDIDLIAHFVPSLMKRIEKGEGCKIGYAKNHNTVIFTMSNGAEYTAHAYETKSLIIMEWYKK